MFLKRKKKKFVKQIHFHISDGMPEIVHMYPRYFDGDTLEVWLYRKESNCVLQIRSSWKFMTNWYEYKLPFDVKREVIEEIVYGIL